MKNTVVTLIGFAVFVACVAAAGFMTRPINEQRRELDLTISDEVYDLPPEMAITQAALGTFRGVAINVLWQRAESLKNEGKFYEAVELGEWITKLQPKFPKVWEFVSWNQAYNISVDTHTPEERWTWVRSGIDLLQRKGGGIDANPNNLRLYQQLAWIYHHKVGMFQDNYNWHYKRALAGEWHTILGAPPKDPEDYTAWITEIANAPASRRGLSDEARELLGWLEDQGYSPDMKALADFTVQSVPIDLPPADAEETNEQALQRVLDALDADGDGAITREERFRTPQSWPEGTSQAAIDELVLFLRRAVLSDVDHNMDPGKMVADTKEFGPLDWRHPAAHAIYWSNRGLERLDAEENRSNSGITNVRRQIFNSLDQMAQQGQVVYDPASEFTSYMPAWAFWIKFDEFFQSLKEEFGEENMERAYGSGYRNRMDQMIAMADLYGEKETAQTLLETLRASYENSRYSDHYAGSLDDFLTAHYAETYDNPDAARSNIASILIQSQSVLYLRNDAEQAQALVQKAQQMHQEYRDRNSNVNDPLYYEIPDFGVFYAQSVGEFLLGNLGVVTAEMSIPDRSQIYWSLDPSSQLREYLWSTRYGPTLQQMAAAQGYDPVQAFPSPEQFASIAEGYTLGERRDLEQNRPEDVTADQELAE